MKFNFKRISAVTSSLLVAGMSVAAPIAAANYPQPFVDDGDADVAVVYGSNANSIDVAQAGNIREDLMDSYEPSSSGSVSVGDGENVNIGDTFGDLKISSNINADLYDDVFPTILASGSVDGEDYDQSLKLDPTSSHIITYDNLGGDEDNYQVNTGAAENKEPVLHIDMTSGELWTYELDFEDSLDAVDAGDEVITIAGQDYTIDPNLEASGNLILYASSNTETFDYKESKTVSVGDETYEIEVIGGSEDPKEVIVSIDGDTYTKQSGETISHDDEDFYVSEIFMNTFGDESSLSIELFVGASEIEITDTEDGTITVDEETIDSVVGHYTTDSDLTEVTGISLTFTPADAAYDYDAVYDEYSYLELGEGITDPVLGSVNVVFDSMSQDFMDEDKSLISVDGGNDRLSLTFTNDAGNEYSVDVLQENEWNILGSGDFGAMTRENRGDQLVLNKDGSEGAISHIAEISDVERAADGSIETVSFSYGDSEDSVNVEDALRRSSDGLYLCYGSDNGFAAGGVVNQSEFSLQTSSCAYDGNASQYGGSLGAIGAANDVDIDLSSLEDTNDEVTAGSGSGNAGTITLTETTDHDDVDSPKDVVLDVTYNSDEEYEVAVDTGSSDVVGAEDDDDDSITGYYLTSLGSYVEAEAEDDTQVEMYTPEEEVTFDVFAAGDVSESSGDDETGILSVKDTEVDSVKDMNLIVVGGSCINSVAADILGGNYCGAEFESETGVGQDQFLIEGVEGAYTSGKIALLVAGYEVQDTRNAAEYLTTQEVDTSSKYIGTSSNSAELVTEEA